MDNKTLQNLIVSQMSSGINLRHLAGFKMDFSANPEFQKVFLLCLCHCAWILVLIVLFLTPYHYTVTDSRSYTKVHIEKFTEIEILIKVLSWSIPFISSVIILSIVTRVLLLQLISTFSNILDHLLGLFFGLIRGVLLLCFLFAGLLYVV